MAKGKRGGAPRTPGRALESPNHGGKCDPRKGVSAQPVIIAGHGRRFRNPKHGPKGSNPKGIEAQRKQAAKEATANL
jgi:hypothetical protein